MAKERKRLYLENGALLQEKLISLSDGKYNPFRVYSIKEIEKATNNYDPQLMFCNNGFCKYYRGSLEGRKVTIGTYRFKNPISEDADEYINDIAMAALLSGNQNILKLLGCCLETSVPSLVYESVDNGNLLNRIHDFSQRHSEPIPWNIRLKIAREIAHAVAYLHTAFGRPIVHTCVTPWNVFLDERNRAKLANFSQAVSLPEGETLKLTSAGWSRGYGSPEFRWNLEVTEKVDVYSFGTFLLEILTGRGRFKLGNLCDSLDNLHRSINEDAFSENHLKYFITCHSIDEIVDRTMFNGGVGFHQLGQWEAIVDLAFLCLEVEKDKRPTMVEVTKKLGQIERSTSVASNARIERSLFEEARMLTDKYSIASNICKYPITRRFSVQELKNATDNYNPDNLFHCSRLGMWYNGSFEGQLVSICKISSCNWHERFNYEFKIATEVDAHENILKLLGCCLEAPVPILVYESADNGNLYEPSNAEGPLLQHMMWSGRLRIASQIAHGLAHLHAVGSIIHGDIRLSNVFLDEHYTVKISNPLCSVPLTSYSKYYPKDDDLSEKIDVYCFGSLILRLLSRSNYYKIKPHGLEDGDFGFQRMKGEPLIQNLKYCLRCLSIDDVVDPKILMEKGEANERNLYQQWQDVVELICKCLEVEKERRPKMTEVAKQLQEIERSSSGRHRSISDNRTVFLDKFVTSCYGLQSPFRVFSTAKLKQATDNYASQHICNYTNLGVWYRGQLGKQNVLICKLSPVNWEEHIKNEFDISAKLRGRKHVLKLLGCCLETPVPALVYEGAQKAHNIYWKGFLYQEINGYGVRKEVFKNSLKIARQVAREIAYLHTSFSSPIVHRNIKSANIFLDKHYNPKLTNFSECTSLHHGETQMTYKLERIKGYAAPEYINDAIVTEKVDVYGFGVLLIELLIGRRLFYIFDEIDKGGFLLDHLKSFFKFPCMDETVNQMVERREGGIREQKQWKNLVMVAFKCLEVAKEERPTMKEIVKEIDRIKSCSASILQFRTCLMTLQI